MLSIIIPAFDEEYRISKTLISLRNFFRTKPERYEIIVLIDGCSDNTLRVVNELSLGINDLIPVLFENRLGKGGAIIEGLLLAKGDLILILDADNAVPPTSLYNLVLKSLDYDLCIGSRYDPDSIILSSEPFYRIFLSRFFNNILKILFWRLRRFSDTQCGAKIVKVDVIPHIIKDLIIVNFAFDVNLIYSTLRHGYSVGNVGITWSHNEIGSKLSKGMLKIAFEMFFALVSLRIFYSRFKYILSYTYVHKFLNVLNITRIKFR